MLIVESELASLRNPRLAALATSAWPAWLWSTDGSQILWTNAVGAAIFGTATTAACAQRRFDANDASAVQIIRLAAMLPAGAPERLERLRGFGAGLGGALTCTCTRIVLADGKEAVLIAAAERAGPALTLSERLHRLFADRDQALAGFAPDGKLLHANAAALARLSGAAMLSALGIETLAATALETGSARGTAQLNGASLEVNAARLGNEDSRVIALALTPQPAAAPRPQSTPEKPEPAPAAAAPEAVVEASPVAAAVESASAPATAQDEPVTERRHPLRFVWHMDADGRFGVGSDEFIDLIGPRTTAAFGRLWSEIADELKLDPNNLVARAVATHETWSGIVIAWPVDNSTGRLSIELSGLPVFDRDRSFRGYRGFGVCRDLERINHLARIRRERPMGFLPAPEPPPQAPAAETPPGPAASATSEAAPRSERPTLNVAPAAANVVPFRPSPGEPKAPPTLSPVERRAFRELAQELTARLREPQQAPAQNEAENPPAEEREAVAAEATSAPDAAAEHLLLDRIPIGILIYRHDALIYANRHFLEWTGFESLAALEAAGGLPRLFAEPGTGALAESAGAQSLSIVTRGGDTLPVEGRMVSLPWNGASALALILTNGQAAVGRRESDLALRAAESENRELKSILDAATDGVITLDPQGKVVAANARAAVLFGQTASDMTSRPLGEWLAPGSESAARDYFERVAKGTNILNNFLDVEARAGEDRIVPLAMTLSRIGGDRFCAVFRDNAARKQIEDELRNAKRDALRAAAAKAEFLAKVSHEIRTPLNAMTGFAEVIMAERFGPIGNERYREYLKDIHNAGTHLVSMLNDLLDLSKIESGQVELTFANVNLNELTQQCVGIMQPQANRARIIIRTALTPRLPLVVADERSLRQIVLNLLSNSIRFTGPGGQVIVSTVFSDIREAVLRVRDTGVGMSEKDILAALEPFRQTATSGSWGSGGTGFGLPLTKALAEANRANFNIKSAPNAGTLIEIAFPPNRVVAE
ncbi:MAG TPA: PAS domain-containing sensor histidine kinase [Xanthobacteraceae bacterium]|nr:PAS domain-containing sensor histidine kinase [Xanthobacteraceae bacterium]